VYYILLCILIFGQEFGGKGYYQKISSLVVKIFNNWKHAIEVFSEHFKKYFHKTNVLYEVKIVYLLPLSIDSVYRYYLYSMLLPSYLFKKLSKYCTQIRLNACSTNKFKSQKINTNNLNYDIMWLTRNSFLWY